ncbi:MAG: T9SS type A sorting domain-containing protein [Bacteroidetes bacterium]|nr:T9SS type A sorting domain-containing protein [Bacteroidota bacterium]
MKKVYILLLFAFSLSNVFGQITLNFRDNGLLPGDSSRTHEITNVAPGNPGENQVWDFSAIHYTGKTTFSGVKEDPALKAAGAGEKSLVLSEDGYDFTYISGENGYEETGYVNTAKMMTMGYTDPIVKMKYPLAYGQQFSDPFTGVAFYNGKSRIDLSGTYTVKADGYGTLVLPDRLIKNTLRIKVDKQSLQIGVCGSTQSHLEKYYWFAPGYRYPVLMVSTTENRYGAKEPVVVTSAWVNLGQQAAGAFAAGTDPNIQAGTGENSVVVYPNPFTEQVTYNYLLRKQVPVSVELYDMSGKFNLRVEKRQMQSEGLHTGTIRAASLGLTPGVYYLRFTLDKQVIVDKIVKI